MAMRYTDYPIAVLGGGNGGHCMTADLTLAGHRVHWYELPELAGGVFAPALARRTVTLTGVGRIGTGTPSLVTTDMAEALAGTKLVNLAIPAFGHPRFFEFTYTEPLTENQEYEDFENSVACNEVFPRTVEVVVYE